MSKIEELKERVNLEEPLPTEYEVMDLGLYKFRNNRFNMIVSLLKRFVEGETEEFRNSVINYTLTKFYEGNINYSAANELAEKFNYSELKCEQLYTHFEDNKCLLSFENMCKSLSCNNFNKDYYSNVKIELNEIITLCNLVDSPHAIIENDNILVIDVVNKVTTSMKIKQFKTKESELRGSILFGVAPISVTEYETLDVHDTKKFSWTFEEEFGNIITSPIEPLADTAKWLKENGYVINTKNLLGNLSNCLRALKSTKDGRCYQVKPPKLVEGFHYRNGEIINVDYPLNEYNADEIREGLKILTDYASYFTEEEREYISTTFKWGLIAPFDYCYKQKNSYIEWLYLHGEGGVGKTKGYGGLVGHLWHDELKNGEFFRGVDTFSTVARARDVVSKNTFSVSLNETECAFEETKQMQEMYKSLVEDSLVGDTRGDKAKRTYAYGTGICTSNGYLEDETGAITRRSIQMVFSRSIREKKMGNEKDFNNKWRIGLKDSPLNKLRAVAHTFAIKFMNDIGNLDLEWREVTDKIVKEIYDDVDLDYPEWISEWVDTEKNLRLQAQDTKEAFNEIFIEVINRKRESNDYLDNPYDFVKPILASRKIAGLYLKDDGEVYLTQGFLNTLKKTKRIDHKIQLKQFADNYGWQYDRKVIKLDGTSRRACHKPYDLFISDIYDMNIL